MKAKLHIDGYDIEIEAKDTYSIEDDRQAMQNILDELSRMAHHARFYCEFEGHSRNEIRRYEKLERLFDKMSLTYEKPRNNRGC